MNIENLLFEITKYSSNNEVKNFSTLHFLEYIRYKTESNIIVLIN